MLSDVESGTLPLLITSKVVAAEGAAGQQKVGVAGHFQPGNRGDFGPDRVREDAFHDAERRVEIAHLCHVADERPAGGRGGGRRCAAEGSGPVRRR